MICVIGNDRRVAGKDRFRRRGLLDLRKQVLLEAKFFRSRFDHVVGIAHG